MRVRAFKDALRPVLGPVVDPVRWRAQVWKYNRDMRAKERNGQLLLVPRQALEQKCREALTELYRRAGAASLGDYLEFGVYNGSSLACMHRALDSLGLIHVRLFGFDSFQGLPKAAKTEDEGVWEPGAYRSPYEVTQLALTEHGVDWDRVTLVKGWFNETCTPELITQHRITRASVIMIDCDIYSSTKTALEFCAPLIGDHAALFFDDWNYRGLADKNLGEKRAFDEFLKDNPHFVVEEFGNYAEIDQVFLLTRRT